MTSSDERIRTVFQELTDHFMKSEQLCLSAAKLTAATVMLRQVRLAFGKGNGDSLSASDENKPAL